MLIYMNLTKNNLHDEYYIKYPNCSIIKLLDTNNQILNNNNIISDYKIIKLFDSNNQILKKYNSGIVSDYKIIKLFGPEGYIQIGGKKNKKNKKNKAKKKKGMFDRLKDFGKKTLKKMKDFGKKNLVRKKIK